MLIKPSGSTSPKCLTCFTDSGGNFFVQVCIIGYYTPQVLETVNISQASAISGDGWLLEVGIWCFCHFIR